MIQVSLIPYGEVEALLPVIAPMLTRALAYTGGRFTLEDVLEDLRTGDQTLWIAITDDNEILGCTTVSIKQYPTGKRALVYEHLAGDDVHLWLDEGHKMCVRYAKHFGCTVLECQGRSGWEPFLKKLGYRKFATIFECDLEV